MRVSRKKRELPELNTSALPDLIFTVLFFFMVVTHMRNYNATLNIDPPKGTHLSNSAKKYANSILSLGYDSKGIVCVQYNGKNVSLKDLSIILSKEISTLPNDEQHNFVVTIKADKKIPLSLLSEVKDYLRKANVRSVYYSAIEETS